MASTLAPDTHFHTATSTSVGVLESVRRRLVGRQLTGEEVILASAQVRCGLGDEGADRCQLLQPSLEDTLVEIVHWPESH